MNMFRFSGTFCFEKQDVFNKWYRVLFFVALEICLLSSPSLCPFSAIEALDELSCTLILGISKIFVNTFQFLLKSDILPQE
jgi:hypothetical protein